MPDHPAERVALVLEVKGGDVPAAVRLRRILKHLWRAYGVRCVSLAQDRPAGQDAAQGTPDALLGEGDGAD